MDNESKVLTTSKNDNVKNGYAIASFVLAFSPIAIIIIGFLFCLLITVGTSFNETGFVWIFFTISLFLLIPVTIIVDILSVILGIKGLKIKKTLFSWVGMGIVFLEVFIIFMIFAITTIIQMPQKIARNQEIRQLQQEISNYETFADLTPFGLGLYKLKDNGDRHLWDITQPEKDAYFYDGVDLVYEVYYNRKDDPRFDDFGDNSNAGKDVQYDVYRYNDTYIIVTPLWNESGTLRYWGFIYLCKELDQGVDLFDVGILDPKVVENLKELPGEKYSRKELSEKLGKTF